VKSGRYGRVQLHVIPPDEEFREIGTIDGVALHVLPRAAAGLPAALPSKQLTFADPAQPPTPLEADG
jgi:hypothetical protein